MQFIRVVSKTTAKRKAHLSPKVVAAKAKPGRFRMTATQLSAVSKRGTDLLMNATPEDLNTFKKWL